MKVPGDEINKLINGSKEEKKELLRYLADNLQEVDKTQINILIEALEKEKSRAIKEKIYLLLLELIPKTGFDALAKMLRSDDPFTRNAAVEIIKISPDCPTSLIKWLARDKDKDVRKLAIDAVSSQKSPEAVAIIRERLNDEEINIVTTAVEYLGNVEDRESAEDIEELLLKTDNKFLQCTCLEALSKIGYSPSSRNIIEKFASENDPLVYFSYLRYVAEFGKKEDLEAILGLMEKFPGLLQREALDAIEKIVTNHGITEVPKRLEKTLVNIMDNTDNSNQKYQVLKILTQISGENFRDHVRELLDSTDEMLKLSAIEILADCGEEKDIELLENIAESTEEDELLEAIGDAVNKIYQRIEK